MPSNHVVEVALEVNMPLLKDLPLSQEVSTDLAGRYTKYSTFAAVESWKGGLDWHVNDSIRFRGTLSRIFGRRTSTTCTSPPAFPRRASPTCSRAATTACGWSRAAIPT